MSDYTILMCTYKATDCLKIQYETLKRLGLLDRLIIYENSPRDFNDNRMFLLEHHIPFQNNINGKHAQTVNSALKKIKTKYCLLLDEDCFLRANPQPIVNFMKAKNFQLLGEVSSSRGGWVLKPRVNPWYCFIDVEWVNSHGIDFMNMEKIRKTDSSKFFGIDEGECRKDGIAKYDVGATFYEDILEKGGKVISLDMVIDNPYDYFFHIEGASWRPDYKEYANFFNTNQKPVINNFKQHLQIS